MLEDKLLTITETAKFLNIGVSTFRRMITNGDAPIFSKIGKSIRFSYQRISEWVEQNEVEI
ncbi:MULTISPECIES: helix-turn-helix domain-containing protein [unclassified Bartonella]|uniref:helix-turn-helix domain-containing protein n=1 Tax=unclassified Bartonella TaxID=2645622 RepID=UPI0015FDFF8F|nr:MULTISPECIES: helix-turn-helix domain-containing protein [unclassified Bartonella]UXN05417.1 helix-turn-helix domain-containing protein [Bartonella sp. HY761]